MIFNRQNKGLSNNSILLNRSPEPQQQQFGGNSDIILTLPTRLQANEKRNQSKKQFNNVNVQMEKSLSPQIKFSNNNHSNVYQKNGAKKAKQQLQPKKSQKKFSYLNQSFSSQQDLISQAHVRVNTPPVSQFNCDIEQGEINLYQKNQNKKLQNQQLQQQKQLKIGEYCGPVGNNNNYLDEKSDNNKSSYKYLFAQKKSQQKQSRQKISKNNLLAPGHNHTNSCNSSQIFSHNNNIKKLKSQNNIESSSSNNNSFILDNDSIMQQEDSIQQQQQKKYKKNIQISSRNQSPRKKQDSYSKYEDLKLQSQKLSTQCLTSNHKRDKSKTNFSYANNNINTNSQKVFSVQNSPKLQNFQRVNNNIGQNFIGNNEKQNNGKKKNNGVIQQYISELQQMQNYSCIYNNQQQQQQQQDGQQQLQQQQQVNQNKKGKLSRQLSPERPKLTKKTIAQYQNLMNKKEIEKQQQEELNQKLRKNGIKPQENIEKQQYQQQSQKKQLGNSKQLKNKQVEQLQQQQQDQNTPQTEKKKPKHLYQNFDEDQLQQRDLDKIQSIFKQQQIQQNMLEQQNQQNQQEDQIQTQQNLSSSNNTSNITQQQQLQQQEQEKTQHTIQKEQDSEIILLLGENDDTIMNNNQSFVSLRHNHSHNHTHNENITHIQDQQQQDNSNSNGDNIIQKNGGFISSYRSVQNILDTISIHNRGGCIDQPQFTKKEMKVLKNIKNSEVSLLNYVFQTHYDIHSFMGTQPNETEVFYQNYRSQLNSCYIVPQLPQEISHGKKYTLVLDMDETLIHCLGTKEKKSDKYSVSELVIIRPHVHQFLEVLSEYYEIVLFTAAIQHYADSVIDQILDPEGKYISHRFYREHCKLQEFPDEGILRVKDINTLGRDLSKIIIIDDKEENLQYQQQNGLLISAWEGESEDSLLFQLIGFLQSIVEQQGDVQKAIQQLKQHTGQIE